MIWVALVITAIVVAYLTYRMLSAQDEAPAPVAGAGKGTPTPKGSPAPGRRQARPGKAGPVQSTADQAEAIDSASALDTGDADSGSPRVPYSVPPPPNDFDDDWDDVDITMVAELPEEIKALQKGYRSVDPKEAIAEIVGQKKEEYDADAEIEVVDEKMMDRLLVEELLVDDETGPNALVLVEGVAKTDQGMRRLNNEDRPISLPDHLVFGVADGMGGHAAGEVASKIAEETIGEAFMQGEFEGEPHNLWPRRGDELARSLEMANLAIYRASCRDEDLSGMGTTLTAIRFCPERQRAYIAHVGDSRCYRIRRGQLFQLTRDHTLGAELGAKGKMATHLSRSVGISDTVQVELMVDAPAVGDRYLLCTDGLTKMVTEDRMAEVAQEENIEQCVKKLIDEANDNGGKDNVTIALVEVRKPA